MTETQARRWAYAAAAAGVIANALFIAFRASFAVQHFTEPHGVTAIFGSAADYAGIPQNALLTVVTSVVFCFLSRRQRPDHVLRIAGVMAFATAAVCGVLTVTGMLPAVSAVAAGAILASAAWLLAIGIRGAELPSPQRPPPRGPHRPADRGHDVVLRRGGADRSSHQRRRRRMDRAHRRLPGLAFDPPLAPGPGPDPGTIARCLPDPRGRRLGSSAGIMTMRTAYRVLAYLLAPA